MSFTRNQWIEKSGFQKVGGAILFPITGCIVSEESTLTRLRFKDQKGVEILIHGPFEIILNGETLDPDKLIPEMLEYVQELVRGSRVIEARRESRKNLLVKLDGGEAAGGEIGLKVDVAAHSDWPWEFWQFNHPDGFLLY